MARYIANNFLTGQLKKSLRAQILAMGLVDTKSLYDSIEIDARTKSREDEIYITVNCLYYYLFLDEGTVKFGAQRITQKWMNRSDTQKAIERIIEDWFVWKTQKGIDLDELAKINPRVYIDFFWMDDPYNGLPKPSFRF